MRLARTHILAAFFICCLIVFFLATDAHAAGTDVASGNCGATGSNVTWTLDSSGLLAITGSGAINDYPYPYAPWYSNKDKIQTITIGKGITRIGDYAFYGCNNLTSITIPSSMTDIGGAAFYYCSKLESIIIPEGVTNIGSGTFSGCSNLNSITLPNSVESIGESAFRNCSSLVSITLPDNVTSVSEEMFYGCDSLTSITIPSNASICDRAFWACHNLTSVIILDGSTSIGNYAFRYCSGLTNITIPSSITSIGTDAFDACRRINRVYYTGSESKWKSVAIGTGNEYLTGAEIYFNSSFDDCYLHITTEACDGGEIHVDRDTTEEGTMVTVTATPNEGYELMTIYVDEKEIEGNSFTVTGNHVVSALFTRIPIVGGTADYQLDGITVSTASGEPLQELKSTQLLASVSIKHLQGTEGATIMLAKYDANGRYQGLLWLTLDEMPTGMTLKTILPIDNSDGKITNLKAFVVSSITSPTPVGNAVSFGSV